MCALFHRQRSSTRMSAYCAPEIDLPWCVWPSSGEQDCPRRGAQCLLHVAPLEGKPIVSEHLEVRGLHIVKPVPSSVRALDTYGWMGMRTVGCEGKCYCWAWNERTDATFTTDSTRTIRLFVSTLTVTFQAACHLKLRTRCLPSCPHLIHQATAASTLPSTSSNEWMTHRSQPQLWLIRNLLF